MSRAWKGGSTRAWRTLRAEVLWDNLLTNGGRCTLRIAGVCTGWAQVAHHTLGRAVTGDDPRYIKAACKACNLRVGNPGRQPDPQPQPRTRW
jgi:hypothetical protein